jgi:hypothetical protein
LTVTNPGPTNPSDSLPGAFQVFTYTLPAAVDCSSDIDPADCANAAGAPNGTWTPVFTPTGVITFDFGSSPIGDGPGYDLVYYERYAPPGIQLDYVTIEVSPNCVDWPPPPLFSWDGNSGGVVGTNIDSYAADGEAYNEVIPSYDLYPGIPGEPNTGIAMDVGVVGAGPFQCVRVRRPPGGPVEAAEIDAIVRLN